eukprot:3045866-Rhodomonas_salina.1
MGTQRGVLLQKKHHKIPRCRAGGGSVHCVPPQVEAVALRKSRLFGNGLGRKDVIQRGAHGVLPHITDSNKAC